MMIKAGTWDSRTHGTEFCIAPYGRMDIGQGIGTIALIDCNAVAIQIVADGRPTRIDLGNSLPINGKQRYICNPYSRTVRGTIIEDAPPSISNGGSATATQFTELHRSSITHEFDKDPDKKSGMLIMPKRGEFHAFCLGLGTMHVSIIPNAKLDYLDELPAGLFQADIGAFGCEGIRNDNIVCRAGLYTDQEVATWIATVGWKDFPVPVSHNQSNYNAIADPNTAFLIHYNSNINFRANVRLTDMGDWSPEWRG